MNDDIRKLSDEELKELSRRCLEMGETVCSRVSDDQEVLEGIRRLLDSTDLLAEFVRLQQADGCTATRILNASLAALVNSQSVLAIATEFRRRALDRN
ncbi:MAG: hypothetical protein ACO1RT_08300 [Planctomycetaceae bacterium]